MTVLSLELSEREEEILAFLTEYYATDASSLFKKSLFELYEDIQDIRFIEDHIAKKEAPEFITGEELFS